MRSRAAAAPVGRLTYGIRHMRESDRRRYGKPRNVSHALMRYRRASGRSACARHVIWFTLRAMISPREGGRTAANGRMRDNRSVLQAATGVFMRGATLSPAVTTSYMPCSRHARRLMPGVVMSSSSSARRPHTAGKGRHGRTAGRTVEMAAEVSERIEKSGWRWH